MSFKPYCDQCETWHKESEGHAEPPTLGTVTLTVGSRSLTLDPQDPRPKFNAIKAEIEDLLIELDVANHTLMAKDR